MARALQKCLNLDVLYNIVDFSIIDNKNKKLAYLINLLLGNICVV